MAPAGARWSEPGADAATEPLAEAAASPANRWWRDVLRRRMLAAADCLAAILVVVTVAPSEASALWLAAAVPLAWIPAKFLGLYDRDHRVIRHLTTDEIPQIAAWGATVGAGIALLLPHTPDGYASAATVAAAGVVAAFACLVLRAAARGVWRRITDPERTVVVGEGELAAGFIRKVRLFPEMHLSLGVEEPLSISALGEGPEGPNRLARRFDRVVVASDRITPVATGALAAACRANEAKLSVVSPLRGKAIPALRLSQVADLPVFEFNTWDPSRSTMLAKRGFDVSVSALLLAVLLPLLPLIALAIRLDSRGPTFFTQLRAGEEGRPFRMLKLRTMSFDAEKRLAEVVRLDELDEPVFKVRGDPRVTRVGRFLRRFSLDELPQLFNVLRGQMSIVGPRPEEVAVTEMYAPEHEFRLSVKPGLTGPMQVYGRGELNFAERLAVELEYIENLSVARDVRILVLTIPTIVRGTGAF